MALNEFNPFSLRGKIILVTGASSGIGKAIAISCAKMGAEVYITGRNVGRLNMTLQEMPHTYSSQAIIADLTLEDDIQYLVSKLPALDGVVQCAGVGSRVLCKNLTHEDVRKVFLPNVEAPIMLQTALLQNKKINKSASVVFIASRASEVPSMGNAAYSATKGAIQSYARCLALEVAPRLIRVNCIRPAMVWTDLILQEGIDCKQLEEEQRKYPLKRYGTPDDVANLAIYLLSSASSWMTGSSIDLSGGILTL